MLPDYNVQHLASVMFLNETKQFSLEKKKTLTPLCYYLLFSFISCQSRAFIFYMLSQDVLRSSVRLASLGYMRSSPLPENTETLRV